MTATAQGYQILLVGVRPYIVYVMYAQLAPQVSVVSSANLALIKITLADGLSKPLAPFLRIYTVSSRASPPRPVSFTPVLTLIAVPQPVSLKRISLVDTLHSAISALDSHLASTHVLLGLVRSPCRKIAGAAAIRLVRAVLVKRAR